MSRMLNKQSNLALSIVAAVVGLPLFVLALWWYGPGVLVRFENRQAQYTSRWYAVYLDNNQVLYGQIRGLTRDTVKLTNVYYIQAVTVGDKTTSNLIRRGSQEVSAPLNYLLVNRARVLYWEAVGDDAPVMKIIKGGT